MTTLRTTQRMRAAGAVAASGLVLLLGSAPALAQQSSTGGTSAGSGGSGTSGSSNANQTPQWGPPTAPQEPATVVAGGQLTIRMAPDALLGKAFQFHGAASPQDAGHTVAIQRLNPTTGAWVTATRSVVAHNGTFLAVWRVNSVGQVQVRALIAASTTASSARRRRQPSGVSQQSSSAAQITVYHPGRATYFGPGFYGKSTACGETMSPSLQGLASRNLPCGTMVQVNYGGRTLTVPVVDRGPYANGAQWDLTSATAQALGMTETETIGTIIVGVAAPGGAGTGTTGPSGPSGSTGSSGNTGGASPGGS